VCVCTRARASESSCEQPGRRAWSARWHIHSKIRNRLDPAYTDTDTHTHTHTHITGWILQLLKSLSTFTQTAKWWQRLVMLTSLECLVGIMKLFERGKRVTASHHAARNSRPGRILHRAITHCVLGPGRPAASTGQCRLQLGIAARCA
jgi:hypothetical protein